VTALDRIHDRLAAQQAQRRPGLSPSRIAACRRQSAYLLHQVPQSDLVDSDAADVGTLIHAGWADMLRHADGYRVEVPLQLVGTNGPTGQTGTCDWIHLNPDHTATIGDLKTKSSKSWQRWLSLGGPDPDIWDQLHLYAAAAQAHPDLTDHHVTTLEIVALDRDSGRPAVWTRPADLDRGRRLADQLRTLQDQLLAAPPDEAPRDGTGNGFPCSYCAWAVRCWGDPAIQPIPDHEAEQAARDYLTASAAEATARTIKQRARERLIGRTIDGTDVSVRWTTTTRRMIDEPATLQLLADLGADAPTRTVTVERLTARWKQQPKDADA
jgi:hypothetical protein